jgi:hypothetical protein
MTTQTEPNDTVRTRAVEAYDDALTSAAEAKDKAVASFGDNPLVALGGGLALGALIASLLPRTRTEDKLLGSVGGRITGAAKSAADAAREAGREKLTELNITKDAGASAVDTLVKGLTEAVKSSGQAALGAVKNK